MDESCARVAAKTVVHGRLYLVGKMVDESCMSSCHDLALKLPLQVVDERWSCIFVSAAGSSVTG